ncbi:MAG TPA: MDR family MFS transporter [Thermomicrobiaceae bacterium]|nr:MDR family MFS transporter [Thermomicrobiaceae bacterium]
MPRRHFDQRIVVAIVYVCGMLMNSIDSTIVTVALATLSRQFNVSPSAIDAVVVSYIVSLAVFIPASGWLGDRFGTKRIFLLALAIFTTASALCGLSGSFGQLIIFRALQGMGGGMLTPVGMAMLYRTFPPEERVQVGRILMLVTILGPASGPILGGFIIEKLSWHWAFFVNIPVGVTAFLFGSLFLKEHREPAAGGFDLAGFLLAGSGFASLMYALSEGSTKGWTAPLVLGTGLAGALILLAFVIVELRVAAPMVQLSVLKDRLFRSCTMTSLFASAGFLGILFLVPLFLQVARGASPLSSGLTTFPEALGVVSSTQVVAWLYPRIGPRRLMCGGLVWVATMMALLCTVGLGTSDWIVRLLMFLIGVGMACVFLPSQAAAFATISRAATGRAATLSSVQRQIGAATGIALVSTVLAAVGPTRIGADGLAHAHLGAYYAAFLMSAVLALIGAGLALAIPDRDAAATMVIRRRAKRGEAPVLVGEAD